MNIEQPPSILPVDSPFCEIPVEYVRDEVIEMMREQVKDLAPDIVRGANQGLSVCEMFVTPEEFVQNIKARNAYEAKIFSMSLSREDRTIMIEHLYATWMISCVYDVLSEYWRMNKRVNHLAVVYLVAVMQKFQDEDWPSSA